jgi:hypothetical protein
MWKVRPGWSKICTVLEINSCATIYILKIDGLKSNSPDLIMVHHKRRASGPVQRVQYLTKHTSRGPIQRKNVLQSVGSSPSTPGRIGTSQDHRTPNEFSDITFDSEPIPLKIPGGKVCWPSHL